MAQLPHLCCIPEHVPPTTQNADTQGSYGPCPTCYISEVLRPETGLDNPCRKTRQQKCHQEATSCLVMHLKASKWTTDQLVETVNCVNYETQNLSPKLSLLDSEQHTDIQYGFELLETI